MLDLELQKAPEPGPEEPRPKRPIGLWIAVGGLAVAIAIAAYIAFFGTRRSLAPAATPAAQAEPPKPDAQPLGGAAAPVNLPPLNETDPVVRDLVRQLTSHPRVAAWLATNGLIRNFTVSVANVSEGVAPARQLGVLRPSTPFRVTERGGALYIDQASYQRYDTLAAAVASIDPAGAARLYTTLKPRLEDASRELGIASFDRTLERAIVSLLETPVPRGEVRVSPSTRGIGYDFADPALENLTAAQKQLVRMGPRNAATVQQSLYAIGRALGIPAERLPHRGQP